MPFDKVNDKNSQPTNVVQPLKIFEPVVPETNKPKPFMVTQASSSPLREIRAAAESKNKRYTKQK